MDSRTGENITAAQQANGVYIWDVTNPLSFKIVHHDNALLGSNLKKTQIRIMFNHQLKKALGMHKCFLDLTIYHQWIHSSGRILLTFKNMLIRFLNKLSVISIQTVLTGCRNVLCDQLKVANDDVTLSHDIKYNIY
nr:replication enhancer protein [Rhynchosia yellow mosaic virus]